MVRITWYDPPGTPRGGYVRERDLYPVRAAGNAESKALPCTMLRDGTFESLDEFATGLVRVRIGDKLGYADRRLKLVIQAIYDGAHRFTKGRAWACIGCTLVSDGEHSWYRGGQAVCLDPRGHKRPEAECGTAGWVPPQLRE